MDPDLRKELDEIHALVRDNHKMLRSVRRSQFLSTLGSIVIWVLVLALPLFLYQQYLAPIIQKVSAVSGLSATTTTNLFGLPTSSEAQKLINFLKGGK